MTAAVVERVPCESLDGLTCPCGNATHLDGFDPVVNDERMPTALADGEHFAEPIYECVACGRRFDTATHDGTTVAVIRGPSLHCRDCKLGAVISPTTGKAKGERDVDPCPAGDDDFHHWTGVVFVDCANPTHDHDAITDPEGNDPTTNLCNHDARPMHYDTTQEWYFHNDPDPARACFLSGPNPDNPCYTHGELADAKARCEGEPWPERHSDTCLWCRHAKLTESRRKHDA